VRLDVHSLTSLDFYKWNVWRIQWDRSGLLLGIGAPVQCSCSLSLHREVDLFMYLYFNEVFASKFDFYFIFD
jgi:hypothetical protein